MLPNPRMMPEGLQAGLRDEIDVAGGVIEGAGAGISADVDSSGVEGAALHVVGAVGGGVIAEDDGRWWCWRRSLGR